MTSFIAAVLVQAGMALAPPVDTTPNCYAHAMIGMDAVINARLGVPPENLLALASQDGADGSGPYARDMLLLVYDAYLWDGAPQDYARRILQACAQG